MSKRLSSDDIGVLIDNWEDIRKLVNDILKNKLKNKAMLKGLVPIEFDEDLVLGYGDWGLVMGLPGLVEIVLKITTDPFEWYLTNIILQDIELRKHPAIPYTLGTAILSIRSKNFPLYIIVRENLAVGISLKPNNPMIKMKDALINEFINPLQEIEQNIADVMNKRDDLKLNLLEISVIHNMMNGEVKNLTNNIKKKLPKTQPNSKFNKVLDLQRKLLDRGIALVDIQSNNLGFRQHRNLNRIFKDVGNLDMECVVVSDLGMAYGTPVFLGSGMIYRDLDEMIGHISSIMGDYGSESQSIRKNPGEYSIESILMELIGYCQKANGKVKNVLLENKSNNYIGKLVSKITKMIPSTNLSDVNVDFLVENELISVIKHWIDPICVQIFDGSEIHIKCYVDSIKNDIALCRLAHDLSFEDESPIGMFSIPYDMGIAHTILDFFMNDKKKKISTMIQQNIPLVYLNTLNGVKYESI
jgi:hypothetical protein